MFKDNDKTDIYQYKGAIHIHSVFSDGTGDVNTISKAAKNANLKWIIITDHNSLDVNEGVYNEVYVFKGNEISLIDNHYISLGVNEVITPTENPQIYVDKTRELGGFGFVAHPDESLKRKNKNNPLRWNDKSIIPDGVEIWNWFSQWGDNYDESNLLTQAYSFLFRNMLVKKPYRETLNWWDNLNKNSEKIIPAIGGLDVHALKVSRLGIPFTIFPYKSSFKTIHNVINLREPLSNNFETAKNQVFNAIKNGNNLILNNKINSKIPQFSISNSNSKVYSGETINLDKNTFLNIKFNKKLEIKIYRYDNEITAVKSNDFTLKLEQEGKYRAEILHKDKGFVYTNPIIVINN